MRTLSYQIPADKSAIPIVKQVVRAVPETPIGTVLVRVSYAGLSNFDRETSVGKRNRSLSRLMKKMSVVSGIEMAGIVASDSGKFNRGDRVVAYTNIFRGPFFHTDYVAVPESKLAHIPKTISLQGAASIVGGALTSIAALERIACVKPGQQVLVTGASGSVGVTAVQLASYLGAQVSGICHSSQTEFVMREGAATAYAYDEEEMPPADNQFDVVFDTAPSMSFSLSARYLTPRGTYITTMPQLDVSGFFSSLYSRRKFGYLMEADTDSKRMARLQALMAAGVFREVVDSIYPLAEASNAFAHQLERGKRGKILIDFTEPV